jgi:amylosucrase
MTDKNWILYHSELSLSRVMPVLRAEFKTEASESPENWQTFETRLRREWNRLFELLLNLYGHHYDFFYHLEQLILTLARSWTDRPESLKTIDAEREADPLWFQSEKMVGGVLYVDLFSGNLSKLREHIPYFKEMGITYLHLMPLFAVPQGNNDGGYAVSSYRAVNTELGTIEELAELAAILRQENISLVLDFVFNHTSDEHEWAVKALEGDPYYQSFYYLFPDREMPDQYERTLRNIFPTVRRGSFTWHKQMKKWVWTTFNSFQWDLNYSNPAVFRAMAEEMLFLANTGVEVLRLDAVAFIWKRLGTDSENQPEAHMLIQAFNILSKIAAPALLFKSEAIVHPDEVMKYISPEECQLSYNPMLMALLWEALATRQTNLLEYAMRKRSRIPENCSWVNYLRCHDDIGWTFDDDDAHALGISPKDHRRFLNDFYTGQFPGSFARGIPFQFDPDSGDLRISGTLASLAGLEQALHENNPVLIDMAVRRIIMLRSIVLSIGGIPLIYLGEEWGMLNDYSYVSDESKAGDSRWVHRPKIRWEHVEKWNDPEALGRQIFNETARLTQLRKSQPALMNGGMEVIGTENPHLFGYIRQHGGQRLLIIANFSDHPQEMAGNRLRVYGVGYRFTDHITGNILSAEDPLQLGPYQFVWLETVKAA